MTIECHFHFSLHIHLVLHFFFLQEKLRLLLVVESVVGAIELSKKGVIHPPTIRPPIKLSLQVPQLARLLKMKDYIKVVYFYFSYFVDLLESSTCLYLYYILAFTDEEETSIDSPR